MGKKAIWAHSPDEGLPRLGLITVDAELADRLVSEGKAQNLRGTWTFKKIQSAPAAKPKRKTKAKQTDLELDE